MLQIHTLPLGAFQTNTYLLHKPDSRLCVVIDPGYEAKTILQEVEALGLEVAAILLTHGHFDHVGAVKKLAEATGCRVFLQEADLALPGMLTAGKLHYTDPVLDGQELTFDRLHLQVLHTPGHTPGSVCYLCEDVLFSGDTLFAGSCGRTDLGGDWNALQHSLRTLAAMEPDYRVFPGHGESTTLAREKQYNPFMR